MTIATNRLLGKRITTTEYTTSTAALHYRIHIQTGHQEVGDVIKAIVVDNLANAKVGIDSISGKQGIIRAES